MAEGIVRHYLNDLYDVESAGATPASHVNPTAIDVMKEIGIDISANTPKPTDKFMEEAFDMVITVCGNAKDNCPTFPGAPVHHHWPFDDPYHSAGTHDQIIAQFRRVRDQIKDKFLAELS